jgi:hypothetical protein
VHKDGTLSAVAGVSLLLFGLAYPHTVLASGLLTGTHTFSAQTSRHKILRINPTCFIAGRRSWAHITLNHVGTRDQVEFVWAMPGVLSTGPGLGPGVYRAKASGAVCFAALSPSRYGRNQIGRWELVAKWPRAAHPFAKTFFRIVGSREACGS